MFISLEQLNYFHNYDYTPYKNNLITKNIWSSYDTSFLNLNLKPIKKILISGGLCGSYPERIQMSKMENIDILKRNIYTHANNNEYNNILNKYIASFTSTVYAYNLTEKKICPTDILLLKTFEILASGSLLIMPLREENKLKEIGLINNINCKLIDMRADIQQQINKILNDDTILDIRKNGQNFAKDNLTSEKKLFELNIFFKITM